MNKIEEAMKGYWGERCPGSYEPECPCCKAWDEYDVMQMELLDFSERGVNETT
ncbi:MAG: hypothetical protein JW384_03735 [Nitrosomonadaceae bacterium]|nr:hypothetical protein [Nitrosomonadaceae bacterium]